MPRSRQHTAIRRAKVVANDGLFSFGHIATDRATSRRIERLCIASGVGTTTNPCSHTAPSQVPFDLALGERVACVLSLSTVQFFRNEVRGKKQRTAIQLGSLIARDIWYSNPAATQKKIHITANNGYALQLFRVLWAKKEDTL